MNPQELRIGNIVFDTEMGQIDTITGTESNRVGLDRSEFSYTSIKAVEPVKLTEEWLLRFGFKNFRDKEVFEIGFNEGLFSLKRVGDVFKHWYFYHKDKMITSNIINVHQLQNLYFDLTDKELVLKPEKEAA